jgi:hypothetical protein
MGLLLTMVPGSRVDNEESDAVRAEADTVADLQFLHAALPAGRDRGSRRDSARAPRSFTENEMTAGGAGVCRRTRRGRRTLVIVASDKGSDHFTHPETVARMKKNGNG